MEEAIKVFLVVALAVLVSIIGYAVKGTLGVILGFIITLLVVGLFSIWRRNSD